MNTPAHRWTVIASIAVLILGVFLSRIMEPGARVGVTRSFFTLPCSGLMAYSPPGLYECHHSRQNAPLPNRHLRFGHQLRPADRTTVIASRIRNHRDRGFPPDRARDY